MTEDIIFIAYVLGTCSDHGMLKGAARVTRTTKTPPSAMTTILADCIGYGTILVSPALCGPLHQPVHVWLAKLFGRYIWGSCLMTMLVHLVRDHVSCSTKASADGHVSVFCNGYYMVRREIKHYLEDTGGHDSRRLGKQRSDRPSIPGRCSPAKD